MRNKLIFGALAAAMAIPSLALAQPDPGCVRSNAATTGTGVALGAIGGALIGNAIGGHHSRGTDTALGAVAGGVAGGALANQHNDPCPQGYYRPGPPPPGYGPGPGPAFDYGPPPVQGTFWYGAPNGLRERLDFVQARISRMRDTGRLSPREFRYDQGELNSIRRQDANLRARDGGMLTPPDRSYLWDRLNTLSQRLRWDARWGY